MGIQEFFVSPALTARRKGELLFGALLALFGVTLIGFLFYLVTLPHMRSSFTNAAAITLLLALAVPLAVQAIHRLLVLSFEIAGATICQTEAHVQYRFLGKRTFLLPINTNIKRRVRLFDSASDTGFRFVTVISASLFNKVAVPYEIGGFEELVKLLTGESHAA